MKVLETPDYLITVADTPHTDYDDTDNLYSKPVMLLDRAPNDDPEKTWNRKFLPRGKKIYQLGVEVPVLTPLKS